VVKVSKVVAGMLVFVLAVNWDPIVTGVLLAVGTLVSVAVVKFGGAWLLRSAKEDFQDSIRQVVRAEMRSSGKRLAPTFEKAAKDIAWCKEELSEHNGETMKDAIVRTEYRVARNTKVLKEVADRVGLELDFD
jgi:Flp pilus assembly protein TadB